VGRASGALIAVLEPTDRFLWVCSIDEVGVVLRPFMDLIGADHLSPGAPVDYGKIVGNISSGGTNIHWIEPIDASEFLLASDTRQVIRVSLYELSTAILDRNFLQQS
jgi:hypothetical protein